MADQLLCEFEKANSENKLRKVRTSRSGVRNNLINGQVRICAELGAGRKKTDGLALINVGRDADID